MIPTLYEATTMSFNDNGLGTLPELYDVEVVEKANDILELTATYPVSGRRYDNLIEDAIILAKPNSRDDEHAFRISDLELDITGENVAITAYSITNDLGANLITDLVISDADGQTAMTDLQNAVESETRFEFVSDITTKSSTHFQMVSPLEAIAGTTGSLLQIWSGEIKRENDRISLLARRGYDDVTTFRLGKNISGLKYAIDTTALVTRIYPYYSKTVDGGTSLIRGATVDSKYIGNYPYVHIKPVDASQEITVTEDMTDKQIVAAIDTWAKDWFTKSVNTGVDKPSVTISLDVLELSGSSELEGKLATLEQLGLFDTVTLFVPEYNIDVTAKVNELHYDPMAGRVTSLVAGTVKTSVFSQQSNALSIVQAAVAEAKNQADYAAVSANGKNTNFFGDSEPFNPKEGDIWYTTELIDGQKEDVIKTFTNGVWVETVPSATGRQVAHDVDDALSQVAAAQKQADDAVAQALAAVNASGLATASAQAASDAASAAKQLATEVSNSFATVQSQAATAASDAATALDQAKSALATANGVSGDYTSLKKIVDDTTATVSTLATQTSVDAVKQTVTTTQALAEQTANGLTLKADTTVVETINNTVKQQGLDLKAAQDQLALTLTASDLTKGLSGYATQTWASQQITATATGLEAKLSQTQEDTATYTDTKVAELKLTVDGLSATFAKQTDLATATAQLKVTTDGLNLVTAVTGAKGEKVTQVIADVNNIKTTMTGANGVTTRLQTLEGFQTTATTQLAGKAEQSQVTQLSNQLTSTITSSGHANLVVDSELTDKTQWALSGDAWSNFGSFGTSGHGQLAVRSTSQTWSRARNSAAVLTQYAVSFGFMVYIQSHSSDAVMRMEVYSYGANGEDLGGNGVNAPMTVTGWQQVKLEGYVPPAGTYKLIVQWAAFGTFEAVLAAPQLVTGYQLGIYQASGVSSSQITQMQDLIDARVTVDGKIAAALSLSADGGGTVLITGKSVHITGATTIDNAVIKSAMIDTITADKIITGTLNAGLLNVIGLNADAIATGTITGANLAINLNTGTVTFQSGRIHSTTDNIDINVDSSYISTSDGVNRVLLKGGQIQFIAPTLFDLQTSPYLSISNDGVGSNWSGATIVGRDSIMLANSANVGSDIMTWELGKNTFSGLISGKNSNGKWNPTILGGAERGVIIVGGPLDDGQVQSSPMIRVGSSTDGQSAGNRIYVRSSYLIVPSIYSKTTGSSANVVVLADGSLHRSTSASKYKTMIERSRSTSMAESLIALPTAHWLDKAELTNYANGEQPTAPKQYFGMIAEDLAAAGLEDLVQRGDTGELEGINYDRIAPALLPLLAKMKQEIEELKSAAKSA